MPGSDTAEIIDDRFLTDPKFPESDTQIHLMSESNAPRYLRALFFQSIEHRQV
jgi:hypothetical protein